MKKYVGRRAHVEACRGSEEENKLYCTKDGKILLEVGVYNTSVGMRGCPSSMGDDVKALIDFLVSGKTVAEIEPEHYLTYVRYGNMISKLVNAKIAAAKLEEIKTSYDNVTWRNWQRDTISDVDGPIHDRQVQWIWDAKGGQGKTFLSKYLVSRGDCVRFENGKSADIKYGYTGQRCVIFDLSRSQMDHINYEIIESVKNGIIYNTKYQCEMRVYKIPHVIVFSNEMPDQMKLSRDRWNIQEVEQASETCRVKGIHHVSMNEQARIDMRQQRIDEDDELMRLAEEAADQTSNGWSDDTDSLPAFQMFNQRR